MAEKKRAVKRAPKPAAVEQPAPSPQKAGECADRSCPVHGEVRPHGRVLSGTVVGAKMHSTVTVVRMRRHFIPKYERYSKRRTKLLVHNPDCLNAQVGDVVKIMETRPLSKTKHFVVIGKMVST